MPKEQGLGNGLVVQREQEYRERYGFKDDIKYVEFKKGLTEDTVREISRLKNEPEWMLKNRLLGYKIFKSKPVPTWGADLSGIDYDDIYYYLNPKAGISDSWKDVPEDIKRTFEKLGVPEAERRFFAGAEAQYDSEVVYHHLREGLEKQGVIFTNTDDAVQRYPELVKKYFGTIIPPTDNKYAALNTATWSGGSFIHVPKGVKVTMPLQAYFRINAEKAGQFERTLIIAEDGADITYVEGCTAPVYLSSSLHSAVVEIIAHKNAHVRYVTIQNWSKNVYNLVTQRAYAYENAHVEWFDANIGCLAKGTKIFADNDVKNIEDVDVGDKVYSLDQNFEISSKNIVGKKENPPSDVYKLTTMNYRELLATPNHPLLVMRKKGKFNYVGWRPVAELKIGDLIAIATRFPDKGVSYKIKELETVKRSRIKFIAPKETNEEITWLLGVYLGDGFLERARVNFAVPETDPANQKVRLIIKNIFGLDNKQHGVTIRVDSVNFAEFIRAIGFGGNARTKTIPQWVFKLPKSQKLAFIEGYLAADGHMLKGHKNLSITSANKSLLEQVKTLAISCGLSPGKISKWERREKKPLGREEKLYIHYQLYFWGNSFERPVCFIPVNKIEYFGKEVTYDIEVEGTQNFIANDIFVHNSKVNMKYPSVYLREQGAKGDIISIAVAGDGQVQDSGGKIYHLAPNTTSQIVSKSVSKGSGVTSYRGLIHIDKRATNSKSGVKCDALLLDDRAKTRTYPYNEIYADDAIISHEASTGKLSEDKMFYLMSRGLSEDDAIATIIMGFIDPLVQALPLEYSVELKRLIKMDTSGSVG